MLVGKLKVKLQLTTGTHIAMGPGKADLLEAIGREGSISAAARAIGMSYRRAWLLVDEANRCFRDPVVDAVPGGGKRGGARLTEQGRELLAAYRRIEADAAAVAETDSYRLLAAALRDEISLPAS